MNNMPVKIRKEWVREELLGAIDAFIENLPSTLSDSSTILSFDDHQEFKKERNRIAKFLGLSKENNINNSSLRSGAVRFKDHNDEWIQANPGDPLYSTAIMVATETYDADKNTWIALNENN